MQVGLEGVASALQGGLECPALRRVELKAICFSGHPSQPVGAAALQAARTVFAMPIEVNGVGKLAIMQPSMWDEEDGEEEDVGVGGWLQPLGELFACMPSAAASISRLFLENAAVGEGELSRLGALLPNLSGERSARALSGAFSLVVLTMPSSRSRAAVTGRLAGGHLCLADGHLCLECLEQQCLADGPPTVQGGTLPLSVQWRCMNTQLHVHTRTHTHPRAPAGISLERCIVAHACLAEAAALPRVRFINWRVSSDGLDEVKQRVTAALCTAQLDPLRAASCPLVLEVDLAGAVMDESQELLDRLEDVVEDMREEWAGIRLAMAGGVGKAHLNYYWSGW